MDARRDDRPAIRRFSLRGVDTYEVAAYQLEKIESAASDIGIPMAATFALIPTGISLSATMAFTTVPAGPTSEAFWSLMWVCYLVGILCCTIWLKNRGQLRQCINEIRENQIAPVAEKEPSGAPDLTATDDSETTEGVAMPTQDVEDNQ